MKVAPLDFCSLLFILDSSSQNVLYFHPGENGQRKLPTGQGILILHFYPSAKSTKSSRCSPVVVFYPMWLQFLASSYVFGIHFQSHWSWNWYRSCLLYTCLRQSSEAVPSTYIYIYQWSVTSWLKWSLQLLLECSPAEYLHLTVICRGREVATTFWDGHHDKPFSSKTWLYFKY